MTIETRAFDLELRNAEDLNEREFIAIGVPYDQVTELRGYKEKFAPGSVINDNPVLIYRHNEPIGTIISHEDTPAGVLIRARISETTLGNDVLTLLKDGALSKMSIGFEPVEQHRDADGVLVRTKAIAKEYSVVPLPAYNNADVLSVRENPFNEANDAASESESIVTETLTADLAEVRQSVEDLTRQFSTFSLKDREPELDTRSAGEILKAIAAGTEERAYTGGTSADTVLKKGWVGDLTRLVDEAATLRKVFATGNLPSEGTFIEFAELGSNSSLVAEVAEGDDLQFGKVAITTRTAPIKTFGGYTQLTRKEIERSSVNILDASLRAQAIAAGKALNAYVRADYSALVTANDALAVDAGPTFKDWVSAAIDAQVAFNAEGLAIDALIVTVDTFKALAEIVDAHGLPILNGQNGVGSFSVKGLNGSLMTIPVVMEPALAAGKDAFVNKDAIRVYQSPIVRLQDENVINLSKDFSLYTYAAVANEIPAGVVPVKVTGIA